VYGVLAPWQVTVLPSPGCQVTETGVAVAVTLSPGTAAGHGIAGLRPAAGRPARAQGHWDAAERPADAVLARRLAKWGAFRRAEPQRAATGLPLLP
jgi:hypothetical protein